MALSKYEMDMCSGPLTRKIIIFTIPLMLSGILQLLFNAADIVVVGRYAGPLPLAAVGSTSSLTNLIVNVFMGLSVGTSVLVARYYGAKENEALSRTAHTAVMVSLICGTILALFGIIAAPKLLAMMDTPPDVIELSVLYMRIYFAGMPMTMLYNFCAAILRSMGDTRRPLYFLSIAGVINVCLNLFFVIVLGMSVDGVAYATIISQTVSAALVVIALVKTPGACRLDLKKMRIYKKELILMTKIGLPAGMQGMIFSASNTLIQSSVNSFGSTVMAGHAASSSLEGFVYTAMNSFHHTALTFTGQNYGAGTIKRIKYVLINCAVMVVVVGVVLGQAMIFFSEPLIGIYSPGDMAVVEAGRVKLTIVVGTHFVCGLMDLMVGMLRGLGCSLLPMMVSIIGVCGIRVVWIFTVFAANHSLEMLYISYPISWLVTVAVHFVCYIVVKRKIDRKASLASET